MVVCVCVVGFDHPYEQILHGHQTVVGHSFLHSVPLMLSHNGFKSGSSMASPFTMCSFIAIAFLNQFCASSKRSNCEQQHARLYEIVQFLKLFSAGKRKSYTSWVCFRSCRANERSIQPYSPSGFARTKAQAIGAPFCAIYPCAKEF